MYVDYSLPCIIHYSTQLKNIEATPSVKWGEMSLTYGQFSNCNHTV